MPGIAAGVALVMRHAGVALEDLDGVHIAGTFGSFVRKLSAQAIGLVPANEFVFDDAAIVACLLRQWNVSSAIFSVRHLEATNPISAFR